MQAENKNKGKPIEALKEYTYSKSNQPTKEQRLKAINTRKANRRLEEDLLDEFFKENVPAKIDGKEVKISGLRAGILRLKQIILNSKNEKLAMDVFFKLLDRIWGKPQIKIEANVSTEQQIYDRAKILEMIFNAKQEKVIDIKTENDEQH